MNAFNSIDVILLHYPIIPPLHQSLKHEVGFSGEIDSADLWPYVAGITGSGFRAGRRHDLIYWYSQSTWGYLARALAPLLATWWPLSGSIVIQYCCLLGECASAKSRLSLKRKGRRGFLLERNIKTRPLANPKGCGVGMNRHFKRLTQVPKTIVEWLVIQQQHPLLPRYFL